MAFPVLFGESAWIPEDSDPTDPRNGLLEQFQDLPTNSGARTDNPVIFRPAAQGW